MVPVDGGQWQRQESTVQSEEDLTTSHPIFVETASEALRARLGRTGRRSTPPMAWVQKIGDVSTFVSHVCGIRGAMHTARMSVTDPFRRMPRSCASTTPPQVPFRTVPAQEGGRREQSTRILVCPTSFGTGLHKQVSATLLNACLVKAENIVANFIVSDGPSVNCPQYLGHRCTFMAGFFAANRLNTRRMKELSSKSTTR